MLTLLTYCRAAFGELFAGQAGQLAERMGRLRQKEAAKREGFLKHAEVRQGTPPLHLLPSLVARDWHIALPTAILTVTMSNFVDCAIKANFPP